MSAQKPQTFNPENVHKPRPVYSHVATTPISGPSKLITIAGQIGVHPRTGEVPSDFLAQVELALENLRQCLIAAGATTRDIVRITHYIIDVGSNASDSFRKQYMDFIGDHRPPSSLIGVTALADPRLLYEIEATAIIAE
ncbi:hypothetical protein ETB97_007128 [Aspergillus alliaceus]|uniref:Uncharacterized protein n=1 Tax=Petromyces alliaceus TaxID=209559 RepID=A0A5N6FWG6_PETAA|nr:Endoribonuclease L-PSP/chorismate mutase-like protein [Aspergillus alliaceus]KAB8233260.1 Endoribonuclease L-PSP/chorismate mutase-like protein [Aspergillus alliaceus]KAF5856571.1 hypothetical protein ETB97_007128 [Aspergillus burnettii]